MANLSIKFEKSTPFGGIFSIMEQFAPLPSLCLSFAFPFSRRPLVQGEYYFRNLSK